MCRSNKLPRLSARLGACRSGISYRLLCAIRVPQQQQWADLIAGLASTLPVPGLDETRSAQRRHRRSAAFLSEPFKRGSLDYFIRVRLTDSQISHVPRPCDPRARFASVPDRPNALRSIRKIVGTICDPRPDRHPDASRCNQGRRTCRPMLADDRAPRGQKWSL